MTGSHCKVCETVVAVVTVASLLMNNIVLVYVLSPDCPLIFVPRSLKHTRQSDPGQLMFLPTGRKEEIDHLNLKLICPSKYRRVSVSVTVTDWFFLFVLKHRSICVLSGHLI